MARGWESKAVEQQQAEMAEKSTGPRLVLSEKQRRLQRQKEGLLLSRKRLVQQLESSPHPRRREMLEQSIREIDQQLSTFQ